MADGFGERLKALRLERGLTQAELGDMVGIPQTVVARMERTPDANPTLETLTKFADALGVTLDQFRPTAPPPTTTDAVNDGKKGSRR